MRRYVLDLQEIGRGDVPLAGGKGAHLGELSRLDGVSVPAGFCVTTDAFDLVAGAVGGQLDRLALVAPDDRDGLQQTAAAVRAVIEATPIPADVAAAIGDAIDGIGATSYAVRSSATAEDLPGASFAGQQDTFLDVTGTAAILDHVRRCWASLFTERAVAYRVAQGFDHRKVRMGVVVQRMVHADAAGVLFTADPVTSSRKVTAIEAVFGLGEALVSGTATPDRYRVTDGRIEATIVTDRPVLRDEDILGLERLGRRIEAHFGEPQDIEWCLAGAAVHVVQSRPITTLYPVPNAGEGPHVFVSVGHQQMMTDPLRPLGLSLFQLTTGRPMYPAGGRLFVDVIRELGSSSRDVLVSGFSRSDPLIGDALRRLVERADLVPPVEPGAPPARVPGLSLGGPIEVDRGTVADLVAGFEARIAALRRDVQARSGTDLFDLLFDDIQDMRKTLADPRSMAVITGAMSAAAWINERALAWLGERSVADALSQSVPNNVTSEMGLALLDVADVVRPHPGVVAYLERATDEAFFDGLAPLDGGPEVAAALRTFLERYGMRCAGEIDVTRTRWVEAPTTLVPLILGNVRAFEPGEGRRRFEQGRALAERKEREILAALRSLPDGDANAAEMQAMIRHLRDLAGYREYPKYHIVSRYLAYKLAILGEARRLAADGVLGQPDDAWFLTLPELRDVVRNRRVDADIAARRAEHDRDLRRTPPRVITSDGEVVTGAYQRTNLPPGALVGLAVSSGVVEGRARVLARMTDATLEPGDILVTAFTDPSWTPLFVSIAALVTEVGGLMTHGAVIAREYGLPAVIGVEQATRRIRDGQRIRVHGTEGWVEPVTPAHWRSEVEPPASHT